MLVYLQDGAPEAYVVFVEQKSLVEKPIYNNHGGFHRGPGLGLFH